MSVYRVRVLDLAGTGPAETIERESLPALVAATRDYLVHVSEGEADAEIAYHNEEGEPCCSFYFDLNKDQAESNQFMAELERLLGASHGFELKELGA